MSFLFSSISAPFKQKFHVLLTVEACLLSSLSWFFPFVWLPRTVRSDSCCLCRSDFLPLPLKLQLYVACLGNLSILVLPRAGVRLEFVFCFSSAMSWMNNLFVFPVHLLAATCFFFGGTHFRLFENLRYLLWRNSWLVSAMYTTNMYDIQDFPKQVPLKKREFLEGLYLVGSD